MLGFFWRHFARAIRLRCVGFLKIFLKVLLAFLRECFVYFLKLYLATHISQTQDSFNSVVVLMFEHVALLYIVN